MTFRVRHLLGLRNYFDLGSISMIPVLWRYSKAKCAHISFARGFTPYLFSIFCLLNKTPIIMQTHGMLTSRSSSFHKILDLTITRRLVRKSRSLLALTSRESDSLVLWDSKLESLVRVLGNPVNIYTGKELEKPRDSVLFAARLHPRKRIVDFIEASRISLARGWHIEYKVLGPDEGELGTLLESLDGLPNLKYLGSTSSEGVLQELSRSKVFALASLDEPWGNVLVSALAMGKPVVLTESSHLASVISDANAGVVVPDRDPAALADAVNFLLNPKVHKKYARNAQAIYRERFNDESIRDALLELYLRCQLPVNEAHHD